MNLYKLHQKPKSLHKHEEAHNTLSRFILDKMFNQKGTKFNVEQMNTIAHDPELAFEYARSVIGKRWPPGEKIIAANAGASYWYSRDVIKGPWPPGERAIEADGMFALYYAEEVIKGKWPPGEEAISNSRFKLEYNNMLSRKRYTKDELI